MEAWCSHLENYNVVPQDDGGGAAAAPGVDPNVSSRQSSVCVVSRRSSIIGRPWSVVSCLSIVRHAFDVVAFISTVDVEVDVDVSVGVKVDIDVNVDVNFNSDIAVDADGDAETNITINACIDVDVDNC